MKLIDFHKFDIAPAKHKGTRFNAEFECRGNGLHRVDVNEADCLGFPLGNSATLRVEILPDDSEISCYVTLYLTDDVLEEFVERYGVKNIQAVFKADVELCYKTRELCGFDEIEEYYGYKIVKLT